MEEDDSDDDGDPFSKMMRDREQSIKIRMSTTEQSDTTRASTKLEETKSIDMSSDQTPIRNTMPPELPSQQT
jgi:hypothetical protein